MEVFPTMSLEHLNLKAQRTKLPKRTGDRQSLDFSNRSLKRQKILHLPNRPSSPGISHLNLQ